jgi:hypothetical protein
VELEQCTIRDWRLNDIESFAKYANNRRAGSDSAISSRIRTESMTQKTLSLVRLTKSQRQNFVSTSTVRPPVELVFDPVKMFIGTPRDLVIGWPKNSGVKAS